MQDAPLDRYRPLESVSSQTVDGRIYNLLARSVTSVAPEFGGVAMRTHDTTVPSGKLTACSSIKDAAHLYGCELNTVVKPNVGSEGSA